MKNVVAEIVRMIMCQAIIYLNFACEFSYWVTHYDTKNDPAIKKVDLIYITSIKGIRCPMVRFAPHSILYTAGKYWLSMNIKC